MDLVYPLVPNSIQEMTVLKAGKQFYKNTVPTLGEGEQCIQRTDRALKGLEKGTKAKIKGLQSLGEQAVLGKPWSG